MSFFKGLILSGLWLTMNLPYNKTEHWTKDIMQVYTKILHVKLLKVMYELIEFCFDRGDNT